jgi:hypothetical protein
MRNLKKKSFKVIKAAEDGTGQAIVATLNVIDHDNDVIRPGAINGEQKVRMIPNHDWHSPWLGKGIMREDGDKLVVDFKMNLNSAVGKEWHSNILFDMENGDPLMEYSFGYHATKFTYGTFEGKKVRFLESLDVPEFGPVLLGAGIGTGTAAIKARGGISEKAFRHVEGSFEELRDKIYPLVRADLISLLGDDYFYFDLEATFLDMVIACVYSPTGESCFQYEIDYNESGDPILGERQAISLVLNVEMLTKKLSRVEDFLRGAKTSSEQCASLADASVVAIQNYVNRSKALAALRGKEGRKFSSSTMTRLQTMLTKLSETSSELQALIDSATPIEDDPAEGLKDRARVDDLFLQFHKAVSQGRSRSAV